MPNERTQKLQHLFDLWEAGDQDRWFEALGPDFTFTPDPSFPDAGTYGADELRGWIGEWQDLWGTVRLEHEDFVDHGDGAFTVRARWHLSPSGGGRHLPPQDFTFVIWLDEDDQAIAMKAFFDEATALAEAEKRS